MLFTDLLLIVLIVVAIALLYLQLKLLHRDTGEARFVARLDVLQSDNERLERALREEQRAGRNELQQGFERFGKHIGERLQVISQHQFERIDDFGQRLAQLTERTDAGLQSLAQRLTEDARHSREELQQHLAHMSGQQRQQLSTLTDDNEKRMNEVRSTLENKLKELQQDNAGKLEQMRATVDEKLHNTLEARLGQSFKLVSERLEAVQRGLGEMQSLAIGVGDLKRVLSNVKTRGILGEVQLAALLEQVLAAEQYASNIATVPGSNERVEFAIRLPGQDSEAPVWLPIDAKFPREDYERLLDAQERADAEAANLAALALERRVREEAKTIREKYIAPPATTDFAILFLPTEGLYAEIIRRPGLFEALQREQRVTIAGPSTLTALLNSLQMGFRTLAIQQRSSEVWQTLAAVKSEFGKFAGVLEKTTKQIDTARKTLEQTGVRSRAIERKLRGVETLSGEGAQQVLEVEGDEWLEEGAEESVG